MADKPKGSSGRGQRNLKVRVKSAKGRKLSSTRWLERQLNDPYVHRARADGHRSRAAYKLIEIDDKYRFLKPGARVVDLGAAPGGWTQVAVARTNTLGQGKGPAGKVVAIDILPVDAIPGATIAELDFLADDAEDRIRAMLAGPADAVISDMAASGTGHRQTDHLRIMALVEAASAFAADILAPGGTFVAKVFAGGAEATLLAELKRAYAKVDHVKPAASRADSSEKYLVAMGFRGGAADPD